MNRENLVVFAWVVAFAAAAVLVAVVCRVRQAVPAPGETVIDAGISSNAVCTLVEPTTCISNTIWKAAARLSRKPDREEKKFIGYVVTARYCRTFDGQATSTLNPCVALPSLELWADVDGVLYAIESSEEP